MTPETLTLIVALVILCAFALGAMAMASAVGLILAGCVRWLIRQGRARVAEAGGTRIHVSRAGYATPESLAGRES